MGAGGVPAQFLRLIQALRRSGRQQDLDEQVHWLHDRSRGIYSVSRISADLHAVDVGATVKRLSWPVRRQRPERLSTTSFQAPEHEARARCRHEDLCERTWKAGKLSLKMLKLKRYLNIVH